MSTPLAGKLRLHIRLYNAADAACSYTAHRKLDKAARTLSLARNKATLRLRLGGQRAKAYLSYTSTPTSAR